MTRTGRQTSELFRSDAPRAFYEGRWTHTDKNTTLQNLLIKKQRFFVQALAGREGSLLDLGCGGGWDFLAGFDPVVGLDLSYSSVQQAAQVYGRTVQGNLTRLPFPENSFDFVVSRDVLGHIPAPFKDEVIAEMYRVLKPGGRAVHYIEALSDDPLSRFAQSEPELYERHFLTPEGHVGLERPHENFARFRRAGFIPVQERSVYKGFIYAERFVQYFDNEYREHSPLVGPMVDLLRPVARARPLRLAVNSLITLGFELFDPVLPDEWAGGVLVYYTK
jgi:SAM-dependent methyltransferase